MTIKSILLSFFMRYGKIGINKPSWRGAYETKVPDTLINTFVNKRP